MLDAGTPGFCKEEPPDAMTMLAKNLGNTMAATPVLISHAVPITTSWNILPEVPKVRFSDISTGESHEYDFVPYPTGTQLTRRGSTRSGQKC